MMIDIGWSDSDALENVARSFALLARMIEPVIMEVHFRACVYPLRASPVGIKMTASYQ